MKKMYWAIMAMALTAALVSCKKDCVCTITVDGQPQESTVVDKITKDQCDTYYWAVPAGSEYSCSVD